MNISNNHTNYSQILISINSFFIEKNKFNKLKQKIYKKKLLLNMLMILRNFNLDKFYK